MLKSSVLQLSGLVMVGLLFTNGMMTAQQQERPFSGMDQAVNRNLAEDAGLPARDPYINTEAMGDLWNLILLAAGGTCGFIIGRRWDQIFGRASRTPRAGDR
jgi:hypothetical protein